MSRVKVPEPFVHARFVGVLPVQGGLGIVLDVGEVRFRHTIPPPDAQLLLESLFSLIVAGKAEVALAESSIEVQR